MRKAVEKIKKGVTCGKTTRISILLFADDVVVLADSKEDLELMLKAIYEFSLKWRLKFNFDKCNVVKFDNVKGKVITYGNCVGKCNCNHHYAFGPQLIKEVLVYKYLGIELDNCLNFKLFKSRILASARGNMARIWSMGIRDGALSVKGAINLWMALIRSIMEYGAEIWGKDKFPEGERIQYNMARRILQCSSMTTKEALLGELGWWTLHARRNYKKLKYWYHIMTLGNDRNPKRVYLVTRSTEAPGSWATYINKLLVQYGVGHLLDNDHLLFNLDGKGNLESKSVDEHKRFWNSYIKGKIHDYEERQWWTEMTKDGDNSKLRTYVTFKKQLRLEKYLLSYADSLGRSMHTSLRTGTNDLEIDRARRFGIHRDLRICRFCNLNLVETERHFVLSCPLYKEYRDQLYRSIANVSQNKWNFFNRSENDIFILLLQGTGDEFQKIIFRIFQSYLVRCFRFRKMKELSD